VELEGGGEGAPPGRGRARAGARPWAARAARSRALKTQRPGGGGEGWWRLTWRTRRPARGSICSKGGSICPSSGLGERAGGRGGAGWAGGAPGRRRAAAGGGGGGGPGAVGGWRGWLVDVLAIPWGARGWQLPPSRALRGPSVAKAPAAQRAPSAPASSRAAAASSVTKATAIALDYQPSVRSHGGAQCRSRSKDG
jgi:hypothetical protein